MIHTIDQRLSQLSVKKQCAMMLQTRSRSFLQPRHPMMMTMMTMDGMTGFYLVPLYTRMRWLDCVLSTMVVAAQMTRPASLSHTHRHTLKMCV